MTDGLPRERYDVVIVGAGMAGCATAQALARADVGDRRRILIIDMHRGAPPRFAGEFIHPRGTQVLDDLDFYGPLREAGAIDVDGFVVFENADAHQVDLHYAKVRGQRPRGIAVHHKTLVNVMRDVIRKDPTIDLLEGWTLRDLIRDRRGGIRGVVIGQNGHTSTVACDLVVGADGKRSAVRKLAGIPAERETIGFTSGIELIDASLPAPTCAHVILGAWGPILAYPILRNEDGSVSSRVTFDLPRELPAKGDRLAQYLMNAYVPYLPAPLSSQVAAGLRDRTLEMAPTVSLSAPPATQPGIALVGDAGGCSHPITASGMTMGLRDAETLGREAARRAHAPTEEPWLTIASLRRYRADHDRYVPTRQALAEAIYETFRGGDEGRRAIRRALFGYWSSGEAARKRSMALLSCAEGRAHVFLAEYLKTARHALGASLLPRHASHYPIEDRLRQVRGAAALAADKLGLVAEVMWAQVRPGWLPRSGSLS